MLVQLSDELSPVLAPRGNTVTLHLDENLTIEADPEKLARVFNNILKNAASYSFPHTEIVISVEKLEHEVIIRFQNSGEDIPNEALASLFNKFYRGDQSRSSDTGGTGLGLAIAKMCIRDRERMDWRSRNMPMGWMIHRLCVPIMSLR